MGKKIMNPRDHDQSCLEKPSPGQKGSKAVEGRRVPKPWRLADSQGHIDYD